MRAPSTLTSSIAAGLLGMLSLHALHTHQQKRKTRVKHSQDAARAGCMRHISAHAGCCGIAQLVSVCIRIADGGSGCIGIQGGRIWTDWDTRGRIRMNWERL